MPMRESNPANETDADLLMEVLSSEDDEFDITFGPRNDTGH
jgi:hypothetical protein